MTQKNSQAKMFLETLRNLFPDFQFRNLSIVEMFSINETNQPMLIFTLIPVWKSESTKEYSALTLEQAYGKMINDFANWNG